MTTQPITGELVKVDGSVGKQYELIKKGDVYSCTCSIWRHIADLESRRTCKHLMLVRGDKFELGRVGEEGILKSDAKLKELMQQERQQQERMMGPPHRHVNGMEQRGDKRPAEGGASQQRDPKRQMM